LIVGVTKTDKISAFPEWHVSCQNIAISAETFIASFELIKRPQLNDILAL